MQLAKRLRPELEQFEPEKQLEGAIQVLTVVMLLPFALISIIGLIIATDVAELVGTWPIVVGMAITLIFLRDQLVVIHINSDARYTPNIHFTMDTLLFWAVMLSFGIPLLWASVVEVIVGNIIEARKIRRQGENPFWLQLQFSMQQIVAGVGIHLLAMVIFFELGGTIPLRPDHIPLVVGIIIFEAMVTTLVITPIMVMMNALTGAATTLQRLFNVTWPLIGLLLVLNPFAILGALLYSEFGLGALVFFGVGVSLVSLISHRLSLNAELNRQYAREMQQLEALSEAILRSPPDGSQLLVLFEQHLPRMFPQDNIIIQLLERDWQLVHTRFNSHFEQDKLWPQLTDLTSDHTIIKNAILPSTGVVLGDAVLAKIKDAQQPETIIGGIYLLRSKRVGRASDSAATIEALASQIASALYRAETHAQILEAQKDAQELELAGQIQATFLPTTIPDCQGWDIDATLTPARQTSGDFYDFIPLEGGCLGVLVADVADKGTGAALYMALTRTLLRTFAMQYPHHPGRALQAVNERILQDTASTQFVTVFYGILQPGGRFVYANAGHNPALVINGSAPRLLTRTGIPLGIFGGHEWETCVIELASHQKLVIFSDGITEAQNRDRQEFGQERLLDILQSPKNAADTTAAVLRAVSDFAAGTPQFDDMTLMVAVRQ